MCQCRIPWEPLLTPTVMLPGVAASKRQGAQFSHHPLTHPEFLHLRVFLVPANALKSRAVCWEDTCSRHFSVKSCDCGLISRRSCRIACQHACMQTCTSSAPGDLLALRGTTCCLFCFPRTNSSFFANGTRLHVGLDSDIASASCSISNAGPFALCGQDTEGPTPKRP